MQWSCHWAASPRATMSSFWSWIRLGSRAAIAVTGQATQLAEFIRATPRTPASTPSSCPVIPERQYTPTPHHSRDSPGRSPLGQAALNSPRGCEVEPPPRSDAFDRIPAALRDDRRGPPVLVQSSPACRAVSHLISRKPFSTPLKYLFRFASVRFLKLKWPFLRSESPWMVTLTITKSSSGFSRSVDLITPCEHSEPSLDRGSLVGCFVPELPSMGSGLSACPNCRSGFKLREENVGCREHLHEFRIRYGGHFDTIATSPVGFISFDRLISCRWLDQRCFGCYDGCVRSTRGRRRDAYPTWRRDMSVERRVQDGIRDGRYGCDRGLMGQSHAPSRCDSLGLAGAPRGRPKDLVIVEAEPSLVPDRFWLEDLSG